MKFEIDVAKKNSRLIISLAGEPSVQGLPTTKIKAYARAIFTNHEFGNDIEEVVYCVKTIFRNYNISKLEVSFTETQFPKKAIYIVDDLYTYEASIVLAEQEGFKDEISVEYCQEAGLNIRATNECCDLTDSTTFDTIMTFIEQCKYTVDNLMNTFPKTYLNGDEKIFIEVYRLFYNTEPDFSDKNIYLYFNTMAYLLEEFGVGIFNTAQYFVSSKSGIECSAIDNMVRKLIPWNNEYHYLELKEDYVTNIQNVSKAVLRHLNRYDNKIEALRNIGLVHYATFGRLGSWERLFKNIKEGCDVEVSDDELKEIIVLFNEIIDLLAEEE